MFSGDFDLGDKMRVEDGRPVIDKEGKIAKIVPKVDQTGSCGKLAPMQGQNITDVTKRCVTKHAKDRQMATGLASWTGGQAPGSRPGFVVLGSDPGQETDGRTAALSRPEGPVTLIDPQPHRQLEGGLARMANRPADTFGARDAAMVVGLMPCRRLVKRAGGDLAGRSGWSPKTHLDQRNPDFRGENE